MSNRQNFPSSLFPLRGDVSAEAGATKVTVIGIEGIPINDPYLPPANFDTLFYNSTDNFFFFANPWDIPIGQVLEFTGYGYGTAAISWLASDTLAVGDGTPGDVSGAMAMTALILFGNPAYDYYYETGYTTIYSGAAFPWSLVLPPNPGSPNQVLTTDGSGVTSWTSSGGGGGGVSSLNSLTGAVTLSAGSGITITPSGDNLTIAATGGGGVPSGSNLVLAAQRSGTEAGFGGFSIILRVFQGQLLCFPTSWKFSISLASGASFVVSAGVIYRTNVDSRVVIDSTPVTWGSSSTPTLTAGETFSDPIALSIDKSHDYWIVVHFTSSTGNMNIGNTAWSNTFAPLLDMGNINGDETGISTGGSIPNVTETEPDVYRVVSV